MRAVFHLFLLLGLSGTALAQASDTTDQRALPADPEAPPSGRSQQRSERIRVEDAGSRVDELRVGGRVRHIAVQPKVGNLPGYEVQSPDGANQHGGSGATTAPRVWNMLSF